ncbi:MAG: DUF721 domain-containing protein [Saprospiraceae bacterium]|nr:DUF721 domain-containing protein [Saprospiraceae bacterium]
MKKHNEISLGEALNQLITELKWKDKLYEQQIKEIWSHNYGQTIANATTKISINERVLTLQINSSAIKHQVAYSKATILKEINQKLNENYLIDIKLL